MKVLSDREKFILAKNNGYIDILLELISSNDNAGTNSFIDGSSKGGCGNGFKNSFFTAQNKQSFKYDKPQ